MEQKRIKDASLCVDFDKVEVKKPPGEYYIQNGRHYLIYYLRSINDDVFFVNCSSETLKCVESSSGGYVTSDDDVGMIEGPEMQYKDVLPREAVKLDEYDLIYDRDLVLGLNIKVYSHHFGNRVFRVSDKGGVKSTVLLWSDGKSGKYVGMEPF